MTPTKFLDSDNSLLHWKLTQLLLAALVSLALAVAANAQVFKIPGVAGNKWIDTRIDVTPGTLISISAEGVVDFGEKAGKFGPAGTTTFANERGYPAETPFRYGLVARVTASRTNPDGDPREDYAYGERSQSCIQSAGHLWLTVNDNQPFDNKGEYLVTVHLNRCDAEGRTRWPASDPQRGLFRVLITGFDIVKEPDDVVNAVESAYVVWDAAEFGARGALVRRMLSGQSVVYGDTSRRRTEVRAGTQGPNGGLTSGDRVDSSQMPSANRLPMLVGEFELTDRENAVVLAPTLWVTKTHSSPNLETYRRRIAQEMLNAGSEILNDLRGEQRQSQFLWNRGYDRDWSSIHWINLNLTGQTDRPVGVSGGGDFQPNAYVLSYQLIRYLFQVATRPPRLTPVTLDFDTARGSDRSATFESRYDDYSGGSYKLLITIERLR